MTRKRTERIAILLGVVCHALCGSSLCGEVAGTEEAREKAIPPYPNCVVVVGCPGGVVTYDLGPYLYRRLTPWDFGVSAAKSPHCVSPLETSPESFFLTAEDIGGPPVEILFEASSIGISGSDSDSCVLRINVVSSVAENDECGFVVRGVFEAVSTEGGTGSVSVSTPDCECEWTAVSNDSWIHILEGENGIGNGEVLYAVEPVNNKSESSREGSITVADRIVPITQVEFCNRVFPGYFLLVQEGTETSLEIPSTGDSCLFRAVDDAAWMGISDRDPTNPGIISLGNPGWARSAHVTISGVQEISQSQDIWIFQQGLLDEGPDLLCLASSGGLWVAENSAGVFDSRGQVRSIGYVHRPSDGLQAIALRLNGDNLYDVINIVPGGYVWRVLATGDGGFGENEHILTTSLEVDSPAGKGVLSADINGDGFDELVQVGPEEIFVLRNDAGTLASQPTETFDGVMWNFATGYEVLVADLDGDGSQDLVAIEPNGDVTRIPLDGPNAGERTAFGNIGRSTESPAEGFTCSGVQIVAADFNGDGMDDLCAIFEGRLETAYSNGTSLDAPMLHGNLGFRFAPYDGEGWFVLSGDVNGDGMDDLVQLSGNGDVWTARSTGTAFRAPFKNGITGFHHRPEGPWQTFLVNLYE